MRDLHGRIVVITGATSGLGALLGGKFADKGAVPVLTGRSSAKLLEAASRFPGTLDTYVMDVTSSQDVERTVNEIMEKYGRIDVLVNNAGFGIFKSALEAPLSDFEEMMDVNYMGVVRCTKAVLPHMVQAGAGNIVNIASMAGKIGTAKSSGYTASKHAVLGFTNSLRQELIGSGVVLSAVNPGPIDTPFFEKADPSGGYAFNVRRFMLKPDRVADEVVDAVVRDIPEKNLPWIAGFGVKLYHLFPRMLDGIFVKIVNRK